MLLLECQQETQLSLTNRATRLEVSQGHQISKHSTIPCVRYDFLLVFYSYFVCNIRDIRLQNAVTLKTGLSVCEGH